MTGNRIILVFLLSLLMSRPCGYAQDTTAAKVVQDTATDKFPKVILVQLRSEQNRLAYLKQKKRYKDLQIATNEAATVATKMRMDFKDNITYCPVYFYIDTNADLVKKRSFEGILFNADSTPVTNIPINDTSEDYIVVYYGYPTSQSRVKDVVTDPRKYTYNSGEPFGRGLVIDNYLLQQISYLYKLEYQNGGFKFRRANKKYMFVSKHSDIQYLPFAEMLNGQLLQQRDKIRIRKYSGLSN